VYEALAAVGHRVEDWGGDERMSDYFLGEDLDALLRVGEGLPHEASPRSAPRDDNVIDGLDNSPDEFLVGASRTAP
jgi:hypothetical protein